MRIPPAATMLGSLALSRCTLLLLLLVLLSVASPPVRAAQDVRGQIQPSPELPDLVYLGANVRVYLRHIPLPLAAGTSSSVSASTPPDAPPVASAAADTSTPAQLTSEQKARQYTSPHETPTDRVTWVKGDGSFIFHAVPTGSYTLEVVSRTHEFNRYRVDVPREETRLPPRIRVFVPGTTLTSLLHSPSSSLLLHPLILHASRRLEFFTSPPPLTLSSMLGVGTPVLLLGVVAVALLFLAPKITAFLDPEAAAVVQGRAGGDGSAATAKRVGAATI